MKKLFIISTFFLHCSFFIIHCSAQPYTAYYNDFENWTDGTPNGIKPLTNPNAQYSQYTPAYSGTYSCKIESSTTNQAAFRIETTIPFPIYWGKKYILSFAAKRLTGEFDLFVKIDEANSSNNGGGLFFTKIVELGSEWKLYEFEFTSKSHHSSIEGNRILITAAFPYPAGDSFAYAIDELKITTFDDHTMEFDYLDINNIKSYIDPIATFQQNTIGVSAEPAFDINYFEVPKNSGKSTIFTSKLWLAGKDNEDQLAVAANKFNQGTEQGAENTDYWVGPISEDYKTVTDTSWYGMNGNQMLVSEIKQFSDTYIQKYHHTFKVSKEEINYHRAHFADSGYEMPWTIKNWPAHGRTEFGESANLAPFMNVAGDASYNPELGDYPRIRGDQAVFFITNDMGGLHTESGSQKAIGAEILGMAYAFNSPDSALQNTIFFTFDIKNKSNTDYHDFYAGFFNDFDIGYPRDEYVGCDTLLNLGYGYNGTEIDGQGQTYAYGENPPAQGLMFLNQKMSAYMYFNNASGAMGDPFFPIQYYNRLQAKWNDGTPLTWWGSGFNPGSEDYTNFAYSGNPVEKTGWTEFTPIDTISYPNPPEDRRFVMSTGPFEFKKGETLSIDIAYPYARSNAKSNLSSLLQLKLNVEDIQEYFDENIAGIKDYSKHPNNHLLKIYPNPSNGQFTIKSEKIIESFELYDVMGKKVYSDSPQTESTQISTKLPSGLYFYRAVLQDHSISSGKVVVQ